MDILMDLVDMPQVSSSFVQSLSELSSTYDAASYVSFFETWGTHYLKSLTMGARMGLLYALPAETIVV
jgi:dolichyl-phosphate-mannose--protein O-mannosyl transferase